MEFVSVGTTGRTRRRFALGTAARDERVESIFDPDHPLADAGGCDVGEFAVVILRECDRRRPTDDRRLPRNRRLGPSRSKTRLERSSGAVGPAFERLEDGPKCWFGCWLARPPSSSSSSSYSSSPSPSLSTPASSRSTIPAQPLHPNASTTSRSANCRTRSTMRSRLAVRTVGAIDRIHSSSVMRSGLAFGCVTGTLRRGCLRPRPKVLFECQLRLHVDTPPRSEDPHVSRFDQRSAAPLPDRTDSCSLVTRASLRRDFAPSEATDRRYTH